MLAGGFGGGDPSRQCGVDRGEPGLRGGDTVGAAHEVDLPDHQQVNPVVRCDLDDFGLEGGHIGLGVDRRLEAGETRCGRRDLALQRGGVRCGQNPGARDPRTEGGQRGEPAVDLAVAEGTQGVDCGACLDRGGLGGADVLAGRACSRQSAGGGTGRGSDPGGDE